MHPCKDLHLCLHPTTPTTWGPVPLPPPLPLTGQGVDREARCVTCQLTPDEDSGSVRRKGGWGLQESRQSGLTDPGAKKAQGLFYSNAAWTGGKKDIFYYTSQ